jgi:hypothetical protein
VVLKVGNGKGAGTQKTQEGKLYYVTTGDIGKGQRKPALDYVEVPVGLKPLITRLVNAMPNGGLKAQFQQALEALS